MVDHVGVFEGVDVSDGEIDTVDEVLGVAEGDEVLVGVLEGEEVIEGVIDGVEEPSHSSPVPQTEAGLSHSIEPP